MTIRFMLNIIPHWRGRQNTATEARSNPIDHHTNEDISDELPENDHILDTEHTDRTDHRNEWATKPKTRARYQRGSRILQSYHYTPHPTSVDEYLDLRSFIAVLRSNQELLLASTTPLEIDHYKTEITKVEKWIIANNILASYFPGLSLEPLLVIPDGNASSLRSTQLTLHVTMKVDQ